MNARDLIREIERVAKESPKGLDETIVIAMNGAATPDNWEEEWFVTVGYEPEDGGIVIDGQYAP